MIGRGDEIDCSNKRRAFNTRGGTQRVLLGARMNQEARVVKFL